MVILPEELKGHPLAAEIQAKIERIDNIACELPGVLIILNVQNDASVVYMSPRGLRQLGISMHDLQQKAGMEYHASFFNPDDAKEYVPKVLDMVMRNHADESVTFFQQVKAAPDSTEFVWHLSAVKVFMRDESGNPLLIISQANPIDPGHELTQKVSRLLDQNNFLRKNYEIFATLSPREREVLKLMALGKSASEIADMLNISVATAETHRRNIKRKLQTSSSYELAQYARIFDLI